MVVTFACACACGGERAEPVPTGTPLAFTDVQLTASEAQVLNAVDPHGQDAAIIVGRSTTTVTIVLSYGMCVGGQPRVSVVEGPTAEIDVILHFPHVDPGRACAGVGREENIRVDLDPHLVPAAHARLIRTTA